MISEGLLAEAKDLFPHKNLNALQTVGYRELFSYFEGEISLEFAIEEIKKTPDDLPKDNSPGSKEMKKQSGLII